MFETVCYIKSLKELSKNILLYAGNWIFEVVINHSILFIISFDFMKSIKCAVKTFSMRIINPLENMSPLCHVVLGINQ